ncbi:MAG TPA: hypothetical protein VGK03_13460, partial [Geothrix sp.]
AAMAAAREGMSTVGRGPFAPFMRPQGAFVFFVEIFLRLRLADNEEGIKNAEENRGTEESRSVLRFSPPLRYPPLS